MTRKPVTNVPASVFQKLLNLARERGEDVNALLAQYAVERMLYRISQSRQADRFVLKGAMLFRVWTGSLHRPTQDLDLLGYGEPDPGRLAKAFAAILREVSDDSDGLAFDSTAVIAEEIRGGQEYGGVRVRIPAKLGTARVTVQIDVGFGDAITPDATERDFPTLLGHTSPRISIYPPETAVAEKVEAICSIGMSNSRMKDYYDLLVMSRRFEFDGMILSRAIAATFDRRGTPLPDADPIGLTDQFAQDRQKQAQWGAFVKRTKLSDAPIELQEVVDRVRRFVSPPLMAASTVPRLNAQWRPGHGWHKTTSPM